MASTRQPQPQVEIFQDPNANLPPDAFAATMKPRPQLQPSAMPLQPIRNPASQFEVVLDPPMSAPQQPSPFKTFARPSPLAPICNNLNFISIPPPTHTNAFTGSPVKKPPMQAPRPYCPPMLQQRPLFTTFNSNLETFEADTFRPPLTGNDNFVDFPEPQYARKQALKRSYSESAPVTDRPFKKAKAEEAQLTHLPEPEDMPVVEDDGRKPTCSYAQMIGMAILRAQNRRLTLSQIYDWIAKTFSYYRNDTKRGWHNSIRHNLSLNKAFRKQERPKSDVGKGSYWVIEPGMEMTFVKDKTRKGNGIANITINPQSIQQGSQGLAHPLAEALAPNPWLGPTRPQTAPALPELSSDATLPASDPALEDDEIADLGPNSLPPGPQSSPPRAINSSPPLVIGEHRRSESSPSQMLHPSSGANRKQNMATMDDSGYFSSIESSVLRNNKSNVVSTSETDLGPARKKPGRAEEEIARIRSSSRDITPSHRRFRSLGSADIMSSSPLRPSPVSKLNPVTPSVVFKKPMRPPPSISPNTQLNLHRKAMQEFTNSPVKSLGMWGSEVDAYSPAFKWPPSVVHNAFDDHFEVYSDGAGTTPATPALASSPLKRSAKLPSLGRANTTANVLSSITNGNARLNAKTPSKFPLLKTTPQIFTPDSPENGSTANLPGYEDQDALFNFGFFADENSSDGEGVDILKGFQKIGEPATKIPGPLNRGKGSRPALGSRSLTSRF